MYINDLLHTVDDKVTEEHHSIQNIKKNKKMQFVYYIVIAIQKYWTNIQII